MDSISIEKYYQSLNEISYISDGINNLTAFKNAEVKILWVLKEAHSRDPKESWDHREFHSHHLFKHRYWKKTYTKIVRISDAILTGVKSISLVKPISEYIEEEIYAIMRQIAIINVKKTAGKSKSNRREITSHYNKHYEMLHQQINEINPDVLINGSGKWEIVGELTIPNSTCISSGKFEAYYSNKKIAIHAEHPMSSYHGYEADILDLYYKAKDKL